MKNLLNKIKTWWNQKTKAEKQKIQIPAICVGMIVLFIILSYTISYLGA
jgi:hypothetical protein